MTEVNPGDLLKCGDEYGVYLSKVEVTGELFNLCYWAWGPPFFSLYSKESDKQLLAFREYFLHRHE